MSVQIPVVESFDGNLRRIYLKQGVDAFHWVEDIYREYINERMLVEEFRKWFPLLKCSGNDPKGSGKFTPRFVTMINGARVVPYDENILITVLGEAITDNADVDPDPFDTTTRTEPLKLYITPPAAEIVRDVAALSAIEALSFGGKVTINLSHGMSGTVFPAGNMEYFSNNMTDALQIAINRRLRNFAVDYNLELGTEAQVPGYSFIGRDALNTRITVLTEADVSTCHFSNCTLSGVLDGLALVKDSVLSGVSGINGIAHLCMINPGVLVLSPGVFHLLDCKSGLPGTESPVIDFNGDGCSLGARGYNGGITIYNKTGPEAVSIDLASGQVKIDLETVTNGTIVVRGDGKCINLATGEHIWTGVYGDLIIINETNSPDAGARAVWSTEIEAGYMAAEILRIVSAAVAGQLSGASGTEISIKDINGLVTRIIASVDDYGNRNTVALDVD